MEGISFTITLPEEAVKKLFDYLEVDYSRVKMDTLKERLEELDIQNKFDFQLQWTIHDIIEAEWVK